MEKKGIQSFRELITYQKAYRLSLEIYKATSDFPKHEIFGIVSQLRRCALSIPCNIAEGYSRNHRKEYLQFLNISLGSCGELDTLLSLAKDLKYLSEEEFDCLYASREEVAKLLWKLSNSLKA